VDCAVSALRKRDEQEMIQKRKYLCAALNGAWFQGRIRAARGKSKYQLSGKDCKESDARDAIKTMLQSHWQAIDTNERGSDSLCS
jgi:hypothetical protein